MNILWARLQHFSLSLRPLPRDLLGFGMHTNWSTRIQTLYRHALFDRYVTGINGFGAVVILTPKPW